jgi:ABC-type multidrug transport system fused ATPase/permease subunit
MNLIIQAASLTGVFRFILIVLVIYYAFTFIMRFIVPKLMQKYVNDFQKKFSEENMRAQDEMNRKKEGEVSIKFVDKDKNKSQHPDDGEYVDFEEIK